MSPTPTKPSFSCIYLILGKTGAPFLAFLQKSTSYFSNLYSLVLIVVDSFLFLSYLPFSKHSYGKLIIIPY